MITRITLENFKGIGEETTIHLRPLTLLFGANSSGKSTILHALAYAREILERHNCDADETLMGGESLDLGGFQEIVHKHDPTEKIRMKFHLDLRNQSLVGTCPIDEYIYKRDGHDVDISNAGDDIKSAAVEFVIGIDEEATNSSRPHVFHYSVEIDGKLLAALTSKKNENGGLAEKYTSNPFFATITALNIQHPALEDGNLLQEVLLPTDSPEPEIPEVVSFEDQFLLPEQADALPNFATAFHYRLCNESDSEKESKPLTDAKRFVRQLLNRLIYGPGMILRQILSETIYIGSVRKTLPRNYICPKRFDPSRWADGMGAWDVMFMDKENCITSGVSRWLEEEGRLNTGYKLIVEDAKFIPPDLQTLMIRSEQDDKATQEIVCQQLLATPTIRSITLRDKKDTRLHPHSVGAGLSQVIPVITAMLNPETTPEVKEQVWPKISMCLVEQPELHLHPVQQAAVGDLLIQAVKGNGDKNKLVVAETHSVHLILRILRRIRENYHSIESDGGMFSADDLGIFYVDSKSGTTEVEAMPISKDGRMLQPWPDSFFDQDLYEKLEGTLGHRKSFQESDVKIKKMFTDIQKDFDDLRKEIEN